MSDKNETPSANHQEGLPEVAQTSRKNPLIFLVLGLVLVGFMLLSFFHHGKDEKKAAANVEETYSVQDTTTKKPSTPTATNQTNQEINQTPLTPQQMQVMQEKQRQLQQRLSAPLMLVNNNASDKSSMGSAARDSVSSDPNTQFLNQVSAEAPETVSATKIGPLNYLIAQGSLIHAVLETAINSDLPGYVRAIVSEPVYAEDGSRVLIPQGSRLIGQYKSGMQQGQSRIFIVWTRAIIPGGISINLGSPGVDSLGVAGMGADEIDRHFWQRFGTAILLSIIGAGASNVGVESGDQYNAAQAYRIAIANSTAQTANQTFQQNSMIPPTLYVNQGKPIMVFVARDLNFQAAMKQVKPKLNIF